MKWTPPTPDRARAGCSRTQAAAAVLIFAMVWPTSSGRGQTPTTSQTRHLDPLLSALPADPAANVAASELSRRPGRQAESSHFVVVYTGDAAAAALLERLEAIYRAHVRFVRALNLPARRPKCKLQVVLFGQYAEFKRSICGRADAAVDSLGFYDRHGDRSLLFDLSTHPEVMRIRVLAEAPAPVGGTDLQRRLDTRQAALTRSIVQHEAAHHVQAGFGIVPSSGQVPRWLTEGLALQFEAKLEDDGWPLAPINGLRLFEYRKLYGDESARLPDVERLLSNEHAWRGPASYPLAWAITRYLCAHQREAFVALLRKAASNEGIPVRVPERRALLHELFGPMDTAWVTRFHAEVMRWPLDHTAFAE